jgi:hypothetical protein
MNLSPHFSKNQFLNGKSKWHEINTKFKAFNSKTFCERISSIELFDAEKLSIQFSKIEFWKTFFSHTPMSSTLERKLQFKNGFQTNILRLKTNRIIYNIVFVGCWFKLWGSEMFAFTVAMSYRNTFTASTTTLEQKLQFKNGFQTNILRFNTNRMMHNMICVGSPISLRSWILLS